jgi:hypothetical protein
MKYIIRGIIFICLNSLFFAILLPIIIYNWDIKKWDKISDALKDFMGVDWNI